MTYALGIDVSKAKLDLALLCPDGSLHTKTVRNQKSGFKALIRWTERLSGTTENLRVCLEASGGYEEEAAVYLHRAGLHDHEAASPNAHAGKVAPVDGVVDGPGHMPKESYVSALSRGFGCRERGSNPHGPNGPTDFKSVASTNSAIPAQHVQCTAIGRKVAHRAREGKHVPPPAGPTGGLPDGNFSAVR